MRSPARASAIAIALTLGGCHVVVDGVGVDANDVTTVDGAAHETYLGFDAPARDLDSGSDAPTIDAVPLGDAPRDAGIPQPPIDWDAATARLDFDWLVDTDGELYNFVGSFDGGTRVVHIAEIRNVTKVESINGCPCAFIADAGVACRGPCSAALLLDTETGQHIPLPDNIFTPIDGTQSIRAVADGCILYEGGRAACGASRWPRAVQGVFGFFHNSCLVLRDGSVECVDRRDEGGIVPGLSVWLTNSPQAVPELHGARMVVHRIGSGCAVYFDGHIGCWGFADQLPEQPLAACLWGGRERPEIIRGTEYVCSDGVVSIPGIHDAVDLKINVGGAQTSMCALRRDGSVWCWGGVTRRPPDFDPPATRLETSVPALVGRYILRQPSRLVGVARAVSFVTFQAEGLSVCFVRDDDTLWCFDGAGIAFPTTPSQIPWSRLRDTRDAGTTVEAGAPHDVATVLPYDERSHGWHASTWTKSASSRCSSDGLVAIS